MIFSIVERKTSSESATLVLAEARATAGCGSD